MVPLTYAALGVLGLSLADGSHSAVSIALAILGIGGLIVLHEYGHYLACRLTKTRVETFSVGFGRRLFGWERVGTGPRRFTVGPRRHPPEAGGFDWRVSLIPLGGYVKMAGEIGGDGTATSGVGAGRAMQPDDYPAKTVPQRLLIAVAGVVMNALTAIALFTVAYAVPHQDTPPVVGDVVPGGPAWKAGVRAGDRVVAYDGQPLRTFFDLRQEVALAPKGAEATLDVRRDGKPVTLRVTPAVGPGEELQTLGVQAAGELELATGDGPPVVVGPVTDATVDGRPARGAAAVEGAVRDRFETGAREVVVAVGGRSATVRRAAPSADGKGPRRLGLAAFVPLRVAALRAGAPSGLAVDDVVVAADGEPVARRSELSTRARLRVLTVARGAAKVDVAVAADDVAAVDRFLDTVALATAAPAAGEPVRVLPSGLELPDGVSPAAAAGVRPGDRLLSVGGTKITTWADVLAAGARFGDAPVALVVETPGEAPRTLSVTPARPVGFVGSTLRPVKETVTADGPVDALALGLRRTATETANVFRVIARFFTGDISFSKNVSGPISIATMSSSAASLGLSVYLMFLAYISVNLAVLNILPIPVLDGGTMMFLLWEGVSGRRPSDRAVGALQMVGFGLLMLLMVFALKNDVTNLFRG